MSRRASDISSFCVENDRDAGVVSVDPVNNVNDDEK